MFGATRILHSFLTAGLRPTLAGGASLVLLASVVACNNQGTTAPPVLAPTVQAAPSSTALSLVPAASPSLSSPIQIADVSVTPSDAIIQIQHVSGGPSDAPVDLSNWNIRVGNVSVTLPVGDTHLQPGDTLLVHAGPAGQTNLSASPGAGPTATLAPTLTGSPSPVLVPVGSTRHDIYLGQQGEPLRAAMQPGTQVQLIDTRNTVVSQSVVPPGAKP
jgi:hypothetical protein